MSQQPDPPKEIFSETSFQLSAATEKLVTTGSLNLSSAEEAESDRKNRDKDKELEREQKRIAFWVKDIGVFVLALLIILLIDIYALTILLKPTASEGQIRFAIATLSSTVTSLLSYLLGRASK